MIKEIEIEKKYKVKKLPSNLEDFEHLTIEQSYLNKGGAPIRLRKFIKDNEIKCIFSKKTRKEKNLVECIEHNIELPETLYQEFLKAKEGRTIVKTRYKIPLEDGAKMDLDVFHDVFEGVCIAEIEYTSIEQANNFKTPDWIEEIEDSEKMSNSYMATKATDITEYADYIAENMNELVLEIGIKLNKDLAYFDDILKNNGLNNSYNVITHDIYYTNKNLDGLTENEMKNSCIRLRSCYQINEKNDIYKIENNLLEDIKSNKISRQELENFEEKLNTLGYKKIFDTKKKDHHYWKDGMNTRVQLQEIENIGLLVYFDNSNYYKYPLETQRKMLIDELNTYGFNISYNELGLDKLRTLYYKKEMYSNNQNA